MPCLLLLILMMGPRLVLFMMFLFSDYLSRAYSVGFWPFVGFFFLPYTTLAYAIAKNSLGGVEGIGFVVCILGILLDFGVIGGGASRRRKPPSEPPAPPKGPGTVDEHGLKRVN